MMMPPDKVGSEAAPVQVDARKAARVGIDASNRRNVLMASRAALACLILVVATCTRARAQDADTPARVAVIALRTLAFDWKFEARVGDQVDVGLVFDPANKASKAALSAYKAAVASLKEAKLRGRAVRWSPVPLDGEKLPDSETTRRLDMVLVMDGTPAKAIAAVRDFCRKHQVTSIGLRREDAIAGLSVAVLVQDKRLKLLVNRKASIAEGMSLSAEVLRLAEVIR